MCYIRSMESITERLSEVFAELGFDPFEVHDLTLVSRRHGSRLYRLRYNHRSYVLKWQAEGGTTEPHAYQLLESLRVPTLTLYARTEDAVLVEDLDSSTTWRPARERDTAYAETGRAVADWYLLLHLAGQDLVARGAPQWLTWEWDSLSPDSVRKLGHDLDLPHLPLWETAARHVTALKEAAQELKLTLTYNDFHWSNLALSQHGPQRALMFDFHLLGIGLAASDHRNVSSGLGPAAQRAFSEAYGPPDPRQQLLDDALSPLADLQVAVASASFPPWARALLDDIQSGRLEKKLHRAVGGQSPESS